jgi:ATP-dependent DNA helicase RecQ
MERRPQSVAEVEQALRQHFGFADFRPGQRQAIAHTLAGRHVLVVMPTGAGKSLIYQLSAVLRSGLTLVISPLISLMMDQVEKLNQAGIPAAYVNSTLPSSEQRRRLVEAAQGAYRLLYVAPERLRSSEFHRMLAGCRIGGLAVDEAHCISQWGHDFRPDYLHIRPAWEDMGRPPLLALTATATPQVQDEIIHLLGIGQAEQVITGFNRPNLTFVVLYTPGEASKLRALKGFLENTEGAGIIYTGTRRDTEVVADFVQEISGLEALFYHAGLDPDCRAAVQDAFMSGHVPIVVATNAFGMGIDRADLRFVLHYALPSTLEAYYQEAGRAGRDGLPASCTLLYSPADRALQEWFIENDAPTREELRHIHASLDSMAQGGELCVAPEDLEYTTGLHQVKIRVGIAQLEYAGALSRLGDARARMVLRVGSLDEGSLSKVAADVEMRRAHRRRQLTQMIAYAEGDTCRRRAILAHFGDAGPAEAANCCDNCQVRQQVSSQQAAKVTSDAEWVALIILDTLRSIKWGGRRKLAQVLKGSRARDISKFGYDQHRFYGKLSIFRVKQLEGLIDQLVATGYLKVVGSERPFLSLTPLGKSALANKAAIPLELPHPIRKEEVARRQAEREAGGTVAYTYQLWRKGLRPAEIAQQRGLAESTIYTHLAQLIAQGRIGIGEVASPGVQARIRAAIEQAGSVEALSQIRALLPEEIAYGLIRCVIEDWKREHGVGIQFPASPSPPVDKALFERLRSLRTRLAQEQAVPLFVIFHDTVLRDIACRQPTTRDELLAIKGVGPRKLEAYGDAVLKIIAEHRGQAMRTAPGTDEVEDFLSRPHPRPLSGPWVAGYALDLHSQFAGSDWQRSRTGELVYRFKYEGQKHLADELARQMADFLQGKPQFGQAEAIVAVPPSTAKRAYDPMTVLAQGLGRKLRLPVLSDALTRRRTTRPQKEMTNLAQKRANVAGAFAGREEVVRGKKLLVIDDLYDSGATMEEVARTLRAAGAAQVYVLTLTKTIHTD